MMITDTGGKAVIGKEWFEMAKKAKKAFPKENENNKTYKLDGTLKEQTEAIRKFLGLKPGQKFSDAIIPDEEKDDK